MPGIFSAGWRWVTDECPGGRKTTAISVKFCAAALVGCFVMAAYYGPAIFSQILRAKAVVDRFDEIADFQTSLNVLAQNVAIQHVRDEALDTWQTQRIDEQARQLLGYGTQVGSVEKDIVRLQSEMSRAQFDIRYLNETTVKVGRR